MSGGIFLSPFSSMSTAENHPSPLRWERRAKRTLMSTRVLDLCGVTYFHPKRQIEKEFTCLSAPDWVNVVPLTKAGEVVLVKQFRYGTNDFSLEVPGGVMEKGEDPVEAGVRELAEETGFGGGKATLLASVHPNPAIQENRCHLVLIEGAELLHALDWDPDEELETSLVPLEQALELARSGKITHSLCVCALFLAAAHMRGSGV